MKNNKGYMLVEIILASIIAFGVAVFIINLTIRLKNKNDDTFYETQIVTDQTIITNKFMQYAISQQADFSCRIEIEDNKIYYYPDKTSDDKILIDNVNEIAIIGASSCTNTQGKITIDIPLSVPQQENDYNVRVEYKYKIGDEIIPTLSLVVNNGTTYSKTHTGIITLSDNIALKNGTYKILYGWSNSTLSCSDLTNSFNFEVTNSDMELTKEVTIDGQTGQGKLYVCNESKIYDAADNYWDVLATPLAEAMYLDNTPPTVTFSLSGSTASWSCSDSHSGVETNPASGSQALSGASVTITKTCTDLAHNSITDSHSYTYKYDMCPGGCARSGQVCTTWYENYTCCKIYSGDGPDSPNAVCQVQGTCTWCYGNSYATRCVEHYPDYKCNGRYE